MKVSIDGRQFDTERATHSWQIILQPDQDWANTVELAKTAEVYRSSAGTFYVHTESGRWRLMDAREILSTYAAFLSGAAKTEIAEVGGLEWE